MLIYLKRCLYAVLLIFFLFSLISCSYSTHIDKDYIAEMNYVNNFKIVVLADLHITVIEDIDEVFSEIDKMILRESPDFIVLLGDNIAAVKSVDALDGLISKLEKYRIPYAPIFGNHDSEGDIGKEMLAERFLNAEHCMFLPGEEELDGVGNYVINIIDGHEIKYSLYFLDSHSYRGNGYDYVYPSQISWYKQTVDLVNQHNYKRVPSLLFLHIPIPEFKLAKDAWENGTAKGYGMFAGDVHSPEINTGLYDAIKELESTTAIFCGHDHGNNCSISYDGISFNFCLKSSRKNYYDEQLLGATVITIPKFGNISVKQSFFE